MSRATLADAKTELVTLIADPMVEGIDAVYDHLPPRQMLNGVTSVCVYTAGISAEFWQISVSIFKGEAGDPRGAQNTLDLLMPAIDTRTKIGPYGPSAWQIEAPTDDEVWTATATYQVGREDGF